MGSGSEWWPGRVQLQKTGEKKRTGRNLGCLGDRRRQKSGEEVLMVEDLGEFLHAFWSWSVAVRRWFFGVGIAIKGPVGYKVW